MIETLYGNVSSLILADHFEEQGMEEQYLQALKSKFLWQVSKGQYGYMFSGSEKLGEDTFAVQVGDTQPTGEWSEWSPFGAVEKRSRDGKRLYLVVRPHTVLKNRDTLPEGEYKTGDIFEMTLGYYFRDIRGELPGHDICGYCGSDNGLHGEYRQGWDCAFCGGN